MRNQIPRKVKGKFSTHRTCDLEEAHKINSQLTGGENINRKVTASKRLGKDQRGDNIVNDKLPRALAPIYKVMRTV
jgi:hypothetical protein